MINNNRIIRIREISANNFPVTIDYTYKCIIEFIQSDGQVLLRKNLLARKQPNWLLQLANRGDCQVKIIFMYREGDVSQTWQKAGETSFVTVSALNGQLHQDLEFKITGWEMAPDLSLTVRLTQSESEENRKNLNVILPQSRKITLQTPADEKTLPIDMEIPQPITLTPQEEVIVKDVWNKVRSFKELLMEMFFKRLLWEEPDLEYYFGDFIYGMGDRFYELFELGIRQLQPHTENVIRESLVGTPIEKDLEWQTIDDYCDLFAGLGMNLSHWLVARKVWMWLLPNIPYLEDYDREDLAKGTDSALYRFFTTYIIIPVAEAMERYNQALTPATVEKMYQSWQFFGENQREKGMEFYQALFKKYPQVLPLFGQSNMNSLSVHLFQSLEFLMGCLAKGDTENLLQELRELGLLHGGVGVPSSAYPAIADIMFTLFERHVPDFTPELKQGWLTLFNRVANIMKQPKVNENKLLKKAKEFLDLISSEQEWESDDYDTRWQEIEAEIKASGCYTHTYEELAYGARVAWRNASQCIGRIQWNNLIVRDSRDVTEPDQIYSELKEHLRMATNKGSIQATMTIFRPRMPKERWGVRIWNPQLIRYGAYEQEDGTILGDPANLELTKKIIELGWQPPDNRSQFDLLPLVVEVPGHKPKLYEFPQEDVLEVEIQHPIFGEFNQLGLRWYAVPAVSNFRLEIGGINYCCIPFNGWYMETEIARDFLDPWRYNLIEPIAHALGLDTSSEQNLWRDRVFLELNYAIVHSFNQAKVTIVDHQTASQQFLSHDLREKKAGRECPANWGWVVPPAGGSTCPVYHHEMRDFHLDPHYYHAADKWKVEEDLDLDAFLERVSEKEANSDRILILYGSETGTAEVFARQAARKLKAYLPKVMALDEYDTNQIASEKLMLIVTSTFAEGEIPANGKKFLEWLKQQEKGSLDGLNYSVMAIGSTVYEHFCAAGIELDKRLKKAGANCIVPLHKGDQIKGQVPTVNSWLGLLSRVLGKNTTDVHINQKDKEIKLQVTYLESPPIEPIITEGYDRGIEVPVIANQELLQDAIKGSRSTHHIILDISHTDLQYNTSDHLAVYPCNPTKLVDDLCERIGVNPDSYFTASYIDHQGRELKEEKFPFPTPISIRQVLTEELDLSIQEPFDDLLAYVYSVTTNSDEQRTLETWLEFLSQGDNTAVCLIQKKHISDNYFTILDIFNQFPSAQIEFSKLLELLPKQKPRLYSISSSAKLYPQEAHITVSILQIETKAGKTRQGLCSNYLSTLKQGDKVRISIRKSNFRPPKDNDAIMLLVGAGTGISPLIAFLQNRQEQLQKNIILGLLQNRKKAREIWSFLGQNVNEELLDPSSKQINGNQLTLISQQENLPGKTYVYFGCRNYNDFLYKEQLKQWVDQGVITELNAAFSRVSESKIYLQDIIAHQGQKIWDLISHPKCYYYVCGDAKMANEVTELLMSIAKKYGNLSHIEAVDFFDKMKQENRFSTDVWGITLNYKEAIKEIQRANYHKAEKWLKMLEES